MSNDDCLAVFEPVAKAVSALLHPHAEVVLHDLRTGRVAGIWNSFSARRIGDESLIEEEISETSDAWGPYPKSGLKGEHLKSVTAVLRGADGTPIGLLCVNLDVTRIEEASRFLQTLIVSQEARPAELFGGDWREHMQTALHNWARDRRVSPSSFTRADRLDVIAEFDSQGLFETRNAVDHAARMLGVSRSSIYNLLRAVRRNGTRRGDE